jgi:hypothetical protein
MSIYLSYLNASFYTDFLQLDLNLDESCCKEIIIKLLNNINYQHHPDVNWTEINMLENEFLYNLDLYIKSNSIISSTIIQCSSEMENI